MKGLVVRAAVVLSFIVVALGMSPAESAETINYSLQACFTSGSGSCWSFSGSIAVVPETQTVTWAGSGWPPVRIGQSVPVKPGAIIGQNGITSAQANLTARLQGNSLILETIEKTVYENSGSGQYTRADQTVTSTHTFAFDPSGRCQSYDYKMALQRHWNRPMLGKTDEGWGHRTQSSSCTGATTLFALQAGKNPTQPGGLPVRGSGQASAELLLEAAKGLARICNYSSQMAAADRYLEAAEAFSRAGDVVKQAAATAAHDLIVAPGGTADQCDKMKKMKRDSAPPPSGGQNNSGGQNKCDLALAQLKAFIAARADSTTVDKLKAELRKQGCNVPD